MLSDAFLLLYPASAFNLNSMHGRGEGLKPVAMPMAEAGYARL
jgi:hypothetical protein